MSTLARGSGLRLHEEPGLAAEAFRNGNRRNEPDYKLEIDFRPTGCLLVREAVKGRLLSKGAEILGLTVEKMRALANSWV